MVVADDEITLESIRAASNRIRPEVKRTPVLTSRTFNEASGVTAFLKAENLQTGGAFKMRGAMNFVRSIPPADLPNGVVAYSSGNHAQAVAIAAQAAGTSATVIMPDDAPKSKVEATRARGAKIIVYDRMREDREAIGRRVAEETGATLIPPYDHPWTVIGQGTCGLEMMEEIDGLDTLVVCVGGGGLIAGCATAAKALNPDIRVIGAEPELANDTWLSRRAGKRVRVDHSATIADGLRTPMPGEVTFPVVQRLVDDIVLVSEEEILEAMRFLMMRLKTVVEPSGAVAAAAVLHRKLPAGAKRVGAVLSGGNVDWEVLRRL